MRKVLTDALAGSERFFNQRIDFRAVGHVREYPVDRFVEFRQQSQWIVSPLAVDFAGSCSSSGLDCMKWLGNSISQ